MALLLVAIASAILLVSIAFRPVLGAERCVRLQLALLPIAHVYAAAVAFIGTAAIIASDIGWTRSIAPRLSRVTILFGGGWVLLAILSFVGNDLGSRNFIQYGKFALFLFTIELMKGFVEADPRRLAGLLKGIAVGALLLCFLFLSFTDAHFDALSVEDWPEFLIGTNEGSFYITIGTIVIPLALKEARVSLPRGAVLFTVLVGLYTMTIWETRGGLVTALTVLALYGLFKFTRYSLLAAGSLLVALAIAGWAIPPVQEGLVNFFDPDQSFSNRERLALYELSLNLVSQSPWNGWGWGSSSELFPMTTFTELSYPHSHSTYAHFAVELGWPGLALLLGLYGALLVHAIKLLRAGQRAEFVLALGFAVTLILFSFVDDLFFGGSRGLIASVMIGFVLSLRPLVPATTSAQDSIPEFENPAYKVVAA